MHLARNTVGLLRECNEPAAVCLAVVRDALVALCFIFAKCVESNSVYEPVVVVARKAVLIAAVRGIALLC